MHRAVLRPAQKRFLSLVTAAAALAAALTASTGAAARTVGPHVASQANATAQIDREPTTAVRNYDTEQLNTAPVGCAVPPGQPVRVAPVVSNVRGHSGHRSLRFDDRSTDFQVGTVCTLGAKAGADLSFAVYPKEVKNGFTMSLLGHWQGGTGAAVPVYHLAVFADGSFKWNGGGETWTGFAPGGTVKPGRWSVVRVRVGAADQSTAQVSVDGKLVGAAKPAGPLAIRDIAGYGFASSGTTSAGDEIFFDDVAMVNQRGYETETVGAVPEACAAAAGDLPATVVGSGAATGSRAVRVNDRSTTAQLGLQCQVSPQQGIDWEFGVHPAELRNNFTFSLLGHLEGPDGIVRGTPRVVFHLSVFLDGSIRWHDLRDWTSVAKGGTVPIGRWSRVRVQVPKDQESARIFVDGKYVAAAGPYGVNKIGVVTGYQFASSGLSALNDDFTIDDVVVGPGVDGPLPGGTGGVQLAPNYGVVGKPDVPGGVVQMPHGAVAFPTDQGTEALVTYAAHEDSSTATGTMLKSSSDWGGKWDDANELNPFHDEQSYHLSRLPDGRVIAVNYHTFMVAGSNDLKATVDTAIYDPAARTWTRREGTMTAPEPMRSATGDSTSRPGHRVGGFLLLHNVVADSDGYLYVGGYGYYKSDPATGAHRFRQVLLRSTDKEGINWEVRATVAKNDALATHPKFEGFGEGAVAFVGGDEMLMVMRTGSYQPMYSARSFDRGLTWSTPQKVVAGPDQLPVTGINPMLLKTPGGKLLLHFGRPGQSVMISPDGKGQNWESPVVIDYRNSGNGALIMTGDDQLLAIGDRGPTWADVKPLEQQIWSRRLTLTP